eukprot:CAMPEP_0118984878 /NCGR_PEP_ID=MMETSP1173-20130426/38681_1 /TAXON_ID=1034831 /ORGANISM="Rhizochromulina marina cf, Strain CCMP1243" /LENGTH=161 /DNA_ID=CAMNT_0006935559 /DNA_START=15 /DNA_END=496 /DNA_ORIENTATION=-
MSSRGDAETAALRSNVEGQLNRLLTQLQDLEDMRDELTDEEYEDMRQDTLDQMREFEGSLESMKAGNTTLVDELNATQMALEAAVKNAFKTPEVIRMFAKREPDALRMKLQELQGSVKLGKIPQEVFDTSAGEIVAALQKMGEELTPQETGVLERSKHQGG